MKGRLLGCALLLWIAVLVIAWWLPKTQTAFWLFLIGGVALWFGAIYLKVRFSRPDTTLGSAKFGSRADVNALAKNKGDLLIGRDPDGGQSRPAAIKLEFGFKLAKITDRILAVLDRRRRAVDREHLPQSQIWPC